MNVNQCAFPESIFTRDGIHVDFVSGVRIGIPPNTPPFRFKLSDADTGEVYDTGILQGDPQEETYLYTRRKYFTRWRVEFYRAGEWFFNYVYDAGGKTVFIDIHHGALGDSVAWLPAAVRFFKKWACRGIVCMKPEHVELYRECYPEIRFVCPSEETDELSLRCYARYGLAVYGYGHTDHELIDFRQNNLIRHAEMILGLDADKTPPKITGGTGEIPGELAGKPYFCIATRASRPVKEWHHKGGWETVCARLKERGFVPVCIDGDNLNMPGNAFDDTGMKPLSYRVKLLRGASFFVGLPSGLSWLAWATGKPVVLISGFTDPYVEFETPYRVSPPPGVCHGCWGTCDQRKPEFKTCFHGKGNECTERITPEMVIEACERAISDYGITGEEAAARMEIHSAGDEKECPICEAKTAHFSAVKWDYHDQKPQAAEWKYYHCDKCGCYFLDEMRSWNPETFAEKVYNEDYIHTDTEFDGTRSRNLFPEVAAMLKEYGLKRVLDYGGGKGLLADLLRKSGWNEAYCFDPFGRKDVPADAGGFDCVVAVEVLEHAIHAKELWATISGKLKPGGIFIATTELCNGLALEKWFYANPRAGHCLLYSAAALDLAAGTCGLQHLGDKGNWHVFRKKG